MNKSFLLFAGLAFYTIQCQSQTVQDYDGNVYNTVTIGTQVWMKENLKVTHYRNGAPIQNLSVISDWVNDNTGAYCDFNNTAGNVTIYGILYNWYAVNNSSNLCPSGWHIPTDAEWTTLATYLGDSSVAGGKMKETGTTHWKSPNTSATNSCSFTGLPGGYRDYFGVFYSLTDTGRFWSATEVGGLFVSKAWSRELSYNSAHLGSYREYENDGCSVRCIKDISGGIEDINYYEKIEIYPNPAVNNITIENTILTKDEIISIYNMQGKLLLRNVIQEANNEIDVSTLAKGIYIVKLEGSKINKVGKFIKE